MSSPTDSTDGAQPTVLIVGAGIAGLTLGLLLERAGIPYKILERAPIVKHLGSAMSFGDSVAPLFRQLGIYEDFARASLRNNQVIMRDEKADLDFIVDFSPKTEFGGAPTRIITRPAMYDILYRRIPREKIFLNKRVSIFKNTEAGVHLTCSDDSEYEGHIVVGADGANSSVRQSIFTQLKEAGRLSASDAIPLPYNCICLVGQTREVDDEEFPELKNELCQTNNMVAIGSPYTWITFTTPEKRICYMAIQHLDQETSKEQDTLSEWGPEAAAAMCNQVRHLPVPNGPVGSTLGTLIDLTPKELISKVTLEEKVFDTWYSGRAVLIGDACHKLSPLGAVGGSTAMHDAICLANWINVLPSLDIAALETIFEEYQRERQPVAVENFKKSQVYATGSAKTILGAVMRFIQRRMPHWLWMRILKSEPTDRPQVSFLPLVEDKGTIPPAPQPSLTKTLEILAATGRSISKIGCN
ncbi:hypothetical protein EMPS_03805 [Entomortierella parvispora]|uniref:FAD-binding domain-containing protein n=1 Tax=Entomortierella parvispora TaxID=205924 RepID=A0A9P3LV75_9FUNG|nr:hypothetical protein EMPS_03805 [Entomortierella parvispora]